MQELNQKRLNQLPIHDSDFLELSISQRETGEIDILLQIILYEDEYNDLCRYKEMLGSKGKMCFLFKDCTSINYITYAGITQRDCIDYINIFEDTRKNNHRKQIEIVMNSGIKLICEADAVMVVKEIDTTPV